MQIRVEGVPFCHELKCWPEYFQAVMDGRKAFEIRRTDRDFCVGDHITLREWDFQTSEYSGREVGVTITYLVPGGEWGLPDGICVLGIVKKYERIRLVQTEVDRLSSIIEMSAVYRSGVRPSYSDEIDDAIQSLQTLKADVMERIGKA